MTNKIIILLLVSLLFIQGCTPIETKTEAVPDQPVLLELKNGPSVNIPVGAIKNQSEVEIAIDKGFTADSGDFKILGTPFRFEVPNNSQFSEVVRLEIPYDESILPVEIIEGNLFATYEVNGKWLRYPSNVDTDRNVIIVETAHNGNWSWGFDRIIDMNTAIRDEMRSYFGNLNDQSNTIEKARAEVKIRELEAYKAWNRLIASAEKYHDDMGPAYQGILDQALGFITLTAADTIAMGLVGSEGLITSTTLGTILAYGGNVVTGAVMGVYFGTLMGDTVLEFRAIYLWIDAQTRLNEARAVLELLENPERTDFYPGNFELITDWVKFQEQGNPGGIIHADWSASAIEIDPEIASIFNTEVVTTFPECAQLNLTPEECANLGEHQYNLSCKDYYPWEKYNCSCGNIPSTGNSTFIFKNDALTWISFYNIPIDFQKVEENKYQEIIPGGPWSNYIIFYSWGYRTEAYVADNGNILLCAEGEDKLID